MHLDACSPSRVAPVMQVPLHLARQLSGAYWLCCLLVQGLLLQTFLGGIVLVVLRVWHCCRLPPLIYLIVRKPPITSGHYWASWFCIIFGAFWIPEWSYHAELCSYCVLLACLVPNALFPACHIHVCPFCCMPYESINVLCINRLPPSAGVIVTIFDSIGGLRGKMSRQATDAM